MNILELDYQAEDSYKLEWLSLDGQVEDTYSSEFLAEFLAYDFQSVRYWYKCT